MTIVVTGTALLIWSVFVYFCGWMRGEVTAMRRGKKMARELELLQEANLIREAKFHAQIHNLWGGPR